MQKVSIPIGARTRLSGAQQARSGGNLPYWVQVKDMFGSALIGLWALDEASGATARDLSGKGHDGSYTVGPTLNQGGVGDGHAAAAFDGGDYVYIHSAGLAAAFNGDECGLLLWAQNANWQSDENYYLFMLANAAVDGSIYLQKNYANIDFGRSASGVNKGVQIKFPVSTDFVTLGLSVSKSGDFQRGYYNGVRGGEVNGLGAWTGAGGLAPGYSAIGALNSVPQWGYVGKMQYVALVNRAVTDQEHELFYSMLRHPIRITALGDSLTWWGPPNWLATVAASYNGGRTEVRNHAVGGNSIMANMDAQTLEAAGDNANIILVALGTNDADDAGITAKYTQNLNALKASNPNARIYCMGILPRIAGNGAVNNPRIQAACAAAGVTYWNTDGWINTATDLDDTVHLNDAGDAKVAMRVLARI